VGRLGRPAGIIGCVGDDDFGWLNIDRLRRDGVDTSAIALLADAVTGSAFVTYTETGERHFTINIANSASASRRRRSLSRCSPIARGFTSFWACATAGEIKGQRTSVSEIDLRLHQKCTHPGRENHVGLLREQAISSL
jgi:sugar/nucleoside kinase (ribokinase family)